MSRPQSYITGFNSLAESAGVIISPSVMRIINELLAMRVAPEVIYELLKSVCPLPLVNQSGNGKNNT